MNNTIESILNRIHNETQLNLAIYDSNSQKIASVGSYCNDEYEIELINGYKLKVYEQASNTNLDNILKLLINTFLESNIVTSPIELILSDKYSGDISEYMQMTKNGSKVVICVQVKENNDIFSILDNVFYIGNSVKWYKIDANECIIIADLELIEYTELIETCTALLEDAVNELIIPIFIGIGGIITDISLLNQSYKQSKDVISWLKKSKSAYGLLEFKDILITYAENNLPDECIHYIHNIYAIKGIDEFINEDFSKIFSIFIKKNLNISDTARDVFLHRNSLKYKFDKLYKLTGLDIRKFNDAICFKFLLAYHNRQKIRE